MSQFVASIKCKAEEAAPGVTTGMILSLCEREDRRREGAKRRRRWFTKNVVVFLRFAAHPLGLPEKPRWETFPP
ncbi:hypothetical protein K1719_008203 [Acacia pycnantha]|nr:hypothetical protein K1719_008203 [Acacia pycnantha]